MSSESLPLRDIFPVPFAAVETAMQARIPSHWSEEWQINEATKLASPLLSGLNRVLQIRQERLAPTSLEQDPFMQDITDIAAHGRLHGYPLVEEDFPAERSWNNFIYRRQALLGIYACNPELATEIARRRVVGLHGSVSGTLLPVFSQGLRPLTQMRHEGAVAVSGERGSHVSALVMAAVSFMQLHENASSQVRNYLDLGNGPLTDDRIADEIGELAAKIRKDSTESQAEGWNYWWRTADAATLLEKMKLRQYLLTPPATSTDALHQDLIRQNFPVAYLIDDSEIRAKPEKDIAGFRQTNDRVHLVSSSVRTEFVVDGGVTSQSIQVVLVPRAHQHNIQALADQAGLDAVIAPIEDVPCIGVS